MYLCMYTAVCTAYMYYCMYCVHVLLLCITIGEKIFELTNDIISEWEIPFEKIHFVVTDNGSNMIKAFKQVRVMVEQQNVPDTEAEEEEAEELLPEEEGIEQETDNEVEEFDRQEADSSTVFKVQGINRLSCFAYTLQLVVAKFNSNQWAKDVLSTAYKVVSNVNRSGKVTKELMQESGKKLVAHCVMRWTAAYLVVKRLLEVKDDLKPLLLKHNLTMLQPDDWENLESIAKLLYDFAMYTNMLGAQSYTTVSAVIPSYLDLMAHLNSTIRVGNHEIAEVATNLLEELKRRFSKLLDKDHSDHNPVYIVGTLLDPRYRH